MTEFVAKRRLYLGAGKYIEKGGKAPEMTPAEREPLLASGALSKAKNPKEDAEPKAVRDPLDHDGNGRKGGSAAKRSKVN